MAVRVCTLRVPHSGGQTHDVYPTKQAPKALHARSGELTHKPSRALRPGEGNDREEGGRSMRPTAR